MKKGIYLLPFLPCVSIVWSRIRGDAHDEIDKGEGM